jgi:hypothetical protein
MPYSTTAKNLMLDALTVDRVRLHSGDPGSAGTSNTIAAAGLTAATFAAAGSGERALSSDVDFTGLDASQSVTHWSAWLNSGTVFRGSGTIGTGDVTANSAGEYTLKASTTKLRITDS